MEAASLELDRTRTEDYPQDCWLKGRQHQAGDKEGTEGDWATGKGFAGTNGRPQESQNSKIANCATLKRQLHFLPHKTKTQKLAGISDRTTIENLSNQVKKSKSETLCSSYLAMTRTNVFGPSCIIFIWTHVRIWLFLYCICMFIFLYLEEHFRMSRFNFFPVRGTECLNRI